MQDTNSFEKQYFLISNKIVHFNKYKEFPKIKIHKKSQTSLRSTHLIYMLGELTVVTTKMMRLMYDTAGDQDDKSNGGCPSLHGGIKHLKD